MKGKILLVIGVIFGLALCYTYSFAIMTDADNVKKVHEVTTVACTVCHVEGNFKELNSYGKDYKEAGRNEDAAKAIADKDSDGDEVKNADEIKAGTSPGDAASK